MKDKLYLIYRKLLAFFGPQHWWPGDSAFEVIVGAILTQNTNWLNVEKAIGNLKQNKVLKPQRLCSLSKKNLARLIRPAGYYNIKADRLKSFLGFFLKNYNGNLKKMSQENTRVLRKRLLSIKGIGPETADSILLYALDKPVFVIDTYTKRILSRHHFIEIEATYDEIQNLFMRKLKHAVQLFNEYHALLVRLGKEFCLKNKPKCQICPLK